MEWFMISKILAMKFFSNKIRTQLSCRGGCNYHFIPLLSENSPV